LFGGLSYQFSQPEPSLVPIMTWIELFVPGRLCLFGEHSDWAGEYRVQNKNLSPGYCITVGTNQGIHARAKPGQGWLRATSHLEGREEPERLAVKAELNTLQAIAEEGEFWSYVAGTAYELHSAFKVDVLELELFRMDLPMQKGLSSSAAGCVLVARAYTRLYDLNLSIREEMELAYQGELRTPSRCGRMDQICAYGQAASFLTFDGDSMEIDTIPLGGPFHMLMVDLKGTKDTVQILRDLNAQFPDSKGVVAAGVREALGPMNAQTTASGRNALIEGDAKQLGKLISSAQETFDRLIAPACPSELSAPRLHRLLSHPRLVDLVYGGKGVGSQGDGTAQLVMRGPAEREMARHIIESELGMSCFDLTMEE
jgi:galactokinase